MENTDGYVINGIYFLAGVKERLFADLSDETKSELYEILTEINDKWQEELLAPFVGEWLFGPFAPKYNVWIPGYIFQAPCKTKKNSVKISEELVKKLKSIYYNPICIAIGEGEIVISDDKFNCYGSAYTKSGKYIDNLQNCYDMIKSKKDIVIL